MTSQAIITLQSRPEEIQGIKNLQSACQINNISEEEAKAEGFVTAMYSIDFLTHMNACTPSIIALSDNQVVGYALVCDKQSFGHHPLLDDLFNHVDKLNYNGVELINTNYVLVGQLCVAKSHRGLGLVQSMYQYFQKTYSKTYSFLITDVDERNMRSIKAHKKSGFEIIHTIEYGESNWHVILWDWNQVSK